MQVWSVTASSNATADGNVNWQEGMAPSQVNDSARAMMASEAKWRDDNSGILQTTGTASAYTVTSNQVSTGNTDGYTIAVQFHTGNNAGATLSVDGGTAAPLQINSGVNVGSREYRTGTIHKFTYIAASTSWVEQSGVGIISVPYNKIQGESDATILGNVQGAGWPPSEIYIGAGLVISTTSTSTSQATFTATTTTTAIPFTITAPAYPPTGAFKNLAIKVTGTSSAAVAADFVTMATSGSSLFITSVVGANINFGASGAVNQLDAGSLASGTWYAIWAVNNAAGTNPQCLASTSFTTPLMPSGFIYKARIGAVVTSTSTASAQLMGTWQFGRRAQYVVGLAATSTIRIISNSTEGDISVPTWVTKSTTNYVPQTASRIFGAMWAPPVAAAGMVAPNGSYGAYNSTTNPPPSVVSGSTAGGVLINTVPYDFLLESTNIYSANNFGTTKWILSCLGWEDNF